MLLCNSKILITLMLIYLLSLLPIHCTVITNINSHIIQDMNVRIICRLLLFNSSLETQSNLKAPAGCGIDLWQVFIQGNYHFCFTLPLIATLPTAVNLQHRSIQSDTKCLLCNSTRPTTTHVLNGCPIVWIKKQYTYRHNHWGTLYSGCKTYWIFFKFSIC